VTSLAALEEKAIKADTLVEDTGVLTIGPFSFPNWYFNQYGKTEGMVDVIKALKRSNDIFFYKTGEWLGITKLVAWAKKMGIGKPLGIELGGEASGLMPDPAWKKSHFSTAADREARNDEWYLGDTYHVSIGQGYLLTTPLQVGMWTNVIANGGKLCRPTIKKIAQDRRDSGDCEDLDVEQKNLDLVIEGMKEACDTGGTGWPLFGFSIKKTDSTEASPSSHSIAVPIACKTGTAEFGDPKNHTHAWFTAFGPMPDEFVSDEIKATESYVSGTPEISVAVLVEGAGEGSNVAAPVAKKILEEWFGR
jgi:penicillin-binding protein 2